MCLFSSQILKSRGSIPKHPHPRALLCSGPEVDVETLGLEPKPDESHSWMRLWGSRTVSVFCKCEGRDSLGPGGQTVVVSRANSQ